jgi:hypothetical protein
MSNPKAWHGSLTGFWDFKKSYKGQYWDNSGDLQMDKCAQLKMMLNLQSVVV